MRPVARIPFRIETGDGVIRGDIRDPGSAWDQKAVPGAAIVVCHGFKGFKDWGFFPSTGDELAVRVGCPVIGFNFRGSGVGADLGSFSRPEAFATNTFSREVEDLETILDGLTSGRVGDAEVESFQRIGILGHSRGAIAAAIVGARRPEVVALTVWGGLSRPERYAELFPADAGPEFVAEIRNLRTGEVLPLRRDVVDDLREYGARLDPLTALKAGGPPLLAIHGERDEAVPVADGRAYAGASPDSRFVLIEGAGHTFDARHPWAGATPALERALASTAAHFRHHLATEH
jgi:pimeloyl-ACP methyl ester carboxylesterase